MMKNLFLWLIIAVVLMSVFSNFGTRPGMNASRISYSEFLQKVNSNDVQSVTIQEDKRIQGVLRSGEAFSSYIPIQDPHLMNDLYKHGVLVEGKEPQKQSMLMHIFINWFPILLFIGVWIFFMRQMQGGGGKGAMSFGKSKARMMGQDQIKTTFDDVAGCEEAKEDVVELVDFLRDPQKFQQLGGRIPSGVLMVGPPGTGKTLLAKAIAGEAKVAFFSISGSDFVEMFVGVGASRVRDMFEQAKKHAPCIIFIDEIDAVGRHRGAGLGGGHDEREQTLNQLLVEMDGFEGTEGVIVIAATNRPDVLDPALQRPGRFDRQVMVGLPDIKGREKILKVHLKKVATGNDVDARVIARGTPGFSGADLANVANEAALLAARANKKKVTQADLENAKDKIMMGAERKSMVMSEEEKRLTAYHEAGHTIVGFKMPAHDPIYKVTIIPRGRALGVTMSLPEKDSYSHTREWLESKIAMAFGGRIAEEMIFGSEKVTTGAASDIDQATGIARKMVTQWGLSDKLGPLKYSEEQDEVFLGHSVARHKEISDETAHLIDEEVKSIVDRNYKKAMKILKDNIDILHLMSDALMKFETLDPAQLKEVMAGKFPSPPAGWDEPSEPKTPKGGTTAKAKRKKSDDKASNNQLGTDEV